MPEEIESWHYATHIMDLLMSNLDPTIEEQITKERVRPHIVKNSLSLTANIL